MHVVVLMLNRGRGSGCVARDQARALIEHGHRVTFMHAEMDDGVEGADRVDIRLHSKVLPVHEYLPTAAGDQQPVSTMTSAQGMRYARDIFAALEAVDDVDVVLAHHASVTAMAVHHFAQRRGIPYVVFAHGTGIEPRHHGGYTDELWREIRCALEGAAGVIVTTDYVRDELVRPLVDVALSRFFVSPCGVDLAEFDIETSVVRQRYDLAGPFVICPGALTRLKGPQNVVEASREYADLAETIFIGGGDLFAELEPQIGDRGRLLGHVPHDDKVALIKAATVLTGAPEKREHFGIIYVEALAAGTVPVAYEGGGVGSIITPDVGRLTPRVPHLLGETIREVLVDGAGRDLLASAGRRRAVAMYNNAKLGHGLVEWLDGLSAMPRWNLDGDPVYRRAGV